MRKGVRICNPSSLVVKEKKEIPPAILIRAVDDYIEAVCEIVTYAKDGGSTRRIAQVNRALEFAKTVYEFLGVKES